MTDVSHLLIEPDNWQWVEFHNKSNQNIRYGFNVPDNANALIVIAEGRTETAEEYFETIRDFNARGYAVAIMDWQGQGMSYRHNDDYSRHHSVGFEQDISDFDEFLNHLKIDLPQILFAHSMGGNIGLRYIADNPNIFKCAYLSAPMLGLNPKRVIKYAAAAILKMAHNLNWLNKYAFGQSQWSETFANIAKHKVSSDKVRREVQPYLFKTRPELRCGGVTFGWLGAALQSIAQLHDVDVCARVKCPVIIAIAGKDYVVDNGGTHKTAALLPNRETIIFDHSQHQIHKEQDFIRTPMMQSFYDFIEKHLS